MEIQNINLNIHYSAPQEVWDKLEGLYREMPYWRGFIEGCPEWYGRDGKVIQASVEPSGLQFCGELPENEWKIWIDTFKEKASNLLGYEIGELEDGFEFKYYDD